MAFRVSPRALRNSLSSVQLRSIYRATWFLWLPALLWLVWRRADVAPLGWLDGLLLLVAVAPAPLAFLGARETGKYGKLIEAAAMAGAANALA